MDAYDVFHKSDAVWDTMYTGPGSVYKVYEWCAKQSLDASGRKPEIVKPDPVVVKNKKSIN